MGSAFAVTRAKLNKVKRMADFAKMAKLLSLVFFKEGLDRSSDTACGIASYSDEEAKNLKILWCGVLKSKVSITSPSKMNNGNIPFLLVANVYEIYASERVLEATLNQHSAFDPNPSQAVNSYRQDCSDVYTLE